MSEERGKDGLTNRERVDAYIKANFAVNPKLRPGDDFFTIARKRWPKRFKDVA